MSRGVGKKHFETVSYEAFHKNALHCGLTDAEMAAATGYAKTNITRWKNNNRVPKAAALASECLYRRQSGQSTIKPEEMVDMLDELQDVVITTMAACSDVETIRQLATMLGNIVRMKERF